MDRSVSNFNVRLRTIRIRDLIIGLILACIASGILMTIFPIIYDSDDLFFIVFVTLLLIFFIWALNGTSGLSQNFSDIFEDETKKEIIYVFLRGLSINP